MTQISCFFKDKFYLGKKQSSGFAPSAATIQEYSGHEYSVPSTCFQEYDVVSQSNATYSSVSNATSSSPRKVGGSDSGFNEARSSGEDGLNEGEVKKRPEVRNNCIHQGSPSPNSY